MRFTVTFKTPDALEYALKDIRKFDADDNEVADDEVLEQREEAEDFASKYISNGEYLTVEFDTEAKTAKVLKK